MFAELAVARQAEQLLESLLGTERRAELDDGVELVSPCVPETMDRAGWYDDGLSRSCPPLAPANPNECGPRDDLEPLLLLGMDVCERDRASGPEEVLEREQLSAGLPRSSAEYDPLPGDGVLDEIAIRSQELIL